MGKGTPKRRYFLIRKKQKQGEKIKKLKERLKIAKTKEEKQKIREKILKVAPHYPLGKFDF